MGSSESPEKEPRRNLKLHGQLRKIGARAEKLHLKAYLVGGAVRDLLLGRQNHDWDIVVEGNARLLAESLAQDWSAHVKAHERFGTFVVTLKDGRHVDIVTARRESYPRAGMLPVVSFSTLRDDLYRRDFALNALALGLSGMDRGDVVDFYGGMADLESRMLRIMHPQSFRDDPTRIFRLARFAARGFDIDPDTERRARHGKRYLPDISDERIREELLAILAEKEPRRSLELLAEWGILRRIFPGVRFPADLAALHKEKTVAARLNFLLRRAGDPVFEKVVEKLKLPRALRREVEDLRWPKMSGAMLSGRDLVAMGYTPGPRFKAILQALAEKAFGSRREACRYVFDKFPKKI